MSFTPNPIVFNKDGSLAGTQMSFFSAYNALSARYKKELERGWAGTFRRHIMPYIEEEPYRVLYSDRPSPQNIPVNVQIGAIILKDILCCHDDDSIRNMAAFDMSVRYALCCENRAEAPFSDNVLTRFRRACIGHYIDTGVDLIYSTFVSLKDRLADLMEIDRSMFSMDSTMIGTWARDMSRLELLYVCNEILIRAVTGYTIHKRAPKTTTVKHSFGACDNHGQLSLALPGGPDEGLDELGKFEEKRLQMLAQAKEILPESLHRYLSPDARNTATYHSKAPYGDRVSAVLRDASGLLAFCERHPEHKSLDEYATFTRIINEQCKRDDGTGALALRKKGEGMGSDIAQSPYDPDATYREKDGEKHRGYSAAFSQAKNPDGETLVMDYSVSTNNTPDGTLGAEILERMPEAGPGEGATVVADGLFSGPEMEAAAKEKNISIVNTNLTGRKPEDHCADHEFGSDNALVKCAGGAVPFSSTVNKRGVSPAKFTKADCDGCPYRDKCNLKEYEDYNRLSASVKAKERAEYLRSRDTEEFKALSDFRNGAETVPSILKNYYGVDKNRSMGLASQKFNLGIAFISTNIRKFLKFADRREKYALA